MLLESRDGTVVELRLTGYAYPSERIDPWEANRLRVVLRVVAPSGSWETEDPCLTTTEAEELASWLERWSAGASGRLVLEEPNLRFAITGAGAGRVRLQVELSPEHPPPGGDMELELDLSGSQLRAGASQLRLELEQFPTRAQPPL